LKGAAVQGHSYSHEARAPKPEKNEQRSIPPEARLRILAVRNESIMPPQLTLFSNQQKLHLQLEFTLAQTEAVAVEKRVLFC
jgi:hypothetical protein